MIVEPHRNLRRHKDDRITPRHGDGYIFFQTRTDRQAQMRGWISVLLMVLMLAVAAIILETQSYLERADRLPGQRDLGSNR